MFSDEEEVSLGFALQDTFGNLMVAFFILFVAVIPFMNPPTDAMKQMHEPPLGKITITATWCSDPLKLECNIDVDLWTQYRGSVEDRYEAEPPVGYSNLGGVTYNLSRDDLGHVYNDPNDNTRNTDQVNFEVASSRGLPPGEHCFNLHLYNLKNGILPVEVSVIAQLHPTKPGDRSGGKFDPPMIIIEKKVQLLRNGHEKNVGCFVLDKYGQPIPEKTFQSDAICLRSPTNMLSGGCG